MQCEACLMLLAFGWYGSLGWVGRRFLLAFVLALVDAALLRDDQGLVRRLLWLGSYRYVCLFVISIARYVAQLDYVGTISLQGALHACHIYVLRGLHRTVQREV